MTTTAIPNRPVFRAQEVCEIADVQPYVLRSWEAEFPDLGMSKTAGGPRIYRRADVERVLRLKHLVFEEGLTLAGARRQLGLERVEPDTGPELAISDAEVADIVDQATRRSLRDVRRGLQWILGVLSGQGVAPEDYVLVAERADASHASRGPVVQKTKTAQAPKVARSKGGRASKPPKPTRGRKR